MKSILLPVACLFCIRTAALSFQSSPTNSIITMKDELMTQNSEPINKHEMPVLSRRGLSSNSDFGNNDFLKKTWKWIPRIRRLPGGDSVGFCFCIPQSSVYEKEEEIFENDADLETIRKRSMSGEVSAWPWYSDRIPIPYSPVSKRLPIDEKCYFASSKYRNSDSTVDQICNEDNITLCCPIRNNSRTILKRFISTYSGKKQTTTSSPDYKSNQFM